MNNEDAQAIFFVIVLIVVLAITLVPFALFIGYVLFQKQKRDRIRTTILRDRGQLIGNHKWLPVRYASEPRFKALFKIFPWEAAGILVIAPGSALFLGQMLSGVASNVAIRTGQFHAQLARQGSVAQWRGFLVLLHYCKRSSETGVLVFGSHKSTKALYDEANNTLLADSASRD